MSIFGVFQIRIFPHSDWIRRDTSYLSDLSVFCPNAEKKKRPEKLRIRILFTHCLFPIYINIPYWWKKEPVKSGQFFSGDQYFSPTNNFTRLKLKPIKSFYQLFFLLNKNQITEIFKKVSALLYHNLSGVG